MVKDDIVFMLSMGVFTIIMLGFCVMLIALSNWLW
jgi:hypothetical protein